MQIRTNILFFLIIFLISCNNRHTRTLSEQGNTFHFITEYKNAYNTEGMLQHTFATEYRITDIGRSRESSSQTNYIYQEGQLIRKEEIDIGDAGEVLSSFIINYQPGRKEKIRVNGSDTIHYHLLEYDSKGRLIHQKKYHHFSASVFDLSIDDNFDEWLTYDSNGLVTKEIFVDHSKNSKKRRTVFIINPLLRFPI